MASDGALPWRLHNLGDLQALQHQSTGEFLCVYGAQPVVAGGPFRLAAFEGRAVLVSVEGDDETRALHFAEDLAKVHEGDAAHSQRGFTSYALRLRLADGGCFQAEWYWQPLATTVGDAGPSQWALRMSLPWLGDFLYGTKHGTKLCVRVKDRWRPMLKKHNMSEDHITDSRKATQFQGPKCGAEPAEPGATPSYAITVPGLIVILVGLAVHREPGGQVTDLQGCMDRASLLLTALVDRVCSNTRLVFSAAHSQCDIVVKDGVVDLAALESSQANVRKTARTAFRDIRFS